MDQQPPPKTAAADTDPKNKPESTAHDPNHKPDSDPKSLDGEDWDFVIGGGLESNKTETPPPPPPAPAPAPAPALAPAQDQTKSPTVIQSEPSAEQPPRLSTASSTGSTGSVRKSVHWSPDIVSGTNNQNYDNNTAYPRDGSGSNPYVAQASPSPSLQPSFSFKDTMVNVKDVLGRWGKRVGEATEKGKDLAGNTWQHLKTAPSFADAAMGRIALGTKVLAEGGYEKIFQQTFETVPEEQLQNSFACYLSTSAGPVMGILYVSTEKLAFCSDNPLSYKSGSETEWSYYKVVIPLHQLKAVNPSTSRNNPMEKYLQVISVDNHEFWFMGFFNYIAATNCLQEALQVRNESV